MYEVPDIADIDKSSAYSQVAASKEFSALPPFSFQLAHEEMQEMIRRAGAEDECARVYDCAGATERVRELEIECRYLDRECQVYAPLHFTGPSDDHVPPEGLKTATGTVIATPQCFLFIENPIDGQTTPCLMSLSLVYTANEDEPEVIELFTPLDDIRINLHTPALN